MVCLCVMPYRIDWPCLCGAKGREWFRGPVLFFNRHETLLVTVSLLSSPYWVDEDLHPSIHLSVTQQESVFSYFALHPPLPYFPIVIYCLYPFTVIYPVLIFSCGEKKKSKCHYIDTS